MVLFAGEKPAAINRFLRIDWIELLCRYLHISTIQTLWYGLVDGDRIAIGCRIDIESLVEGFNECLPDPESLKGHI